MWTYGLQALFYAGFALLVGALASWPRYQQVPQGAAQVKLAFNHSGTRIEECRRVSTEELAKLPSNQRRVRNCSRERLPVVIRLAMDGVPIYEAVLEPSGFFGDGQARAYEKFIVPAGKHLIEARLRDSARAEGFDYERKFEADLAPWQNLSIDFKAEQGGFLFR